MILAQDAILFALNISFQITRLRGIERGSHPIPKRF